MTAPTRLLIVDDNEAIRDLWARVFSARGFEVRTAPDGAVALRLVQEDPPDAIVLDLMLPSVNGIQVLMTVRQHSHLSKIPVIITTGTVTSAFELRDFGPLRVLRKPFGVASLVSAVAELLARSQRTPHESG